MDDSTGYPPLNSRTLSPISFDSTKVAGEGIAEP